MNTEFIALEVPHQGEPQAYWVFDADQLLELCREESAATTGVVYEEVRVADLVKWAGEVTPAIGANAYQKARSFVKAKALELLDVEGQTNGKT